MARTKDPLIEFPVGTAVAGRTVIGEGERAKDGRRLLLMRCDGCTAEASVRPSDLRNGGGCPKCTSTKDPLIEFPVGTTVAGRTVTGEGERAKDGTRRLLMRCDGCTIEAGVKPSDLRNGRGCPKCTSTKDPLIEFPVGTTVAGRTVIGEGERAKNGARRLLMRCDDCTAEASVEPPDLRKGARCGVCTSQRCIVGVSNDLYVVTRKRCCERRRTLLFTVTEKASGEVFGEFTHPEVRTTLIPDEAEIVCGEAYAAVGSAIYRGDDSPWLAAIGTTVDELRSLLPLSGKRRGDEVGHIIPRSHAVASGDPEACLLVNHPFNLEWQSKKKNMRLNARIWLRSPNFDRERAHFMLRLSRLVYKSEEDFFDSLAKSADFYGVPEHLAAQQVESVRFLPLSS